MQSGFDPAQDSPDEEGAAGTSWSQTGAAAAPSHAAPRQYSPWQQNTLPLEMGDAVTPLPKLYALIQSALDSGLAQFRAANFAQAWVHYGNAVGAVGTAQRAFQGACLPAHVAENYMKACSNFALCATPPSVTGHWTCLLQCWWWTAVLVVDCRPPSYQARPGITRWKHACRAMPRRA